MNCPPGVPGPTRVMRSFSSVLSMAAAYLTWPQQCECCPVQRDTQHYLPDPGRETPFAEKRSELVAGPNEVGATDVAGEYQAALHPVQGTDVEDTEHLHGRARAPGEVRPYQQQPVDIASHSKLPPRYWP